MAEHLDLPEEYRRRVVGALHGIGASWLDGLPEVIEALAEQWDLSMGEAFPPAWSYVVRAVRSGGEQCVLKIGLPPGEDEDPAMAETCAREARALRLAGSCAVRLVEEDQDAGALLLAYADGGRLGDVCLTDDDLATEILASVMAEFWRPAAEDSGLPPVSSVEHTFEAFDRGLHGAAHRGRDLVQTLGEIDSGIRDLRRASTTARRVLQELAATEAPAMIVHGDLHHDNVIEDEGRGWSDHGASWVVIDPKGYAGDPGYDTGVMLYNPTRLDLVPDDAAGFVRRRLDTVAPIVGIDRDILSAWGYVRAVVSLLDSLEDGGELDRDDPRLRVASALRRMI